jgi:GGDEF domain-containing protein
VYRLGGDEFCLLVSDHLREAAVRDAAAALTERGEGFAVTCSYGLVAVPQDSADVSGALGLADRRLYAVKERRPVSALRQSRDVLLEVLPSASPTCTSTPRASRRSRGGSRAGSRSRRRSRRTSPARRTCTTSGRWRSPTRS